MSVGKARSFPRGENFWNLGGLLALPENIIPLHNDTHSIRTLIAITFSITTHIIINNSEHNKTHYLRSVCLVPLCRMSLCQVLC
jgi:hypothetical protein